tara:strand:- start:63454 stop:63729 length:276 start_codon:yes stop_codon:yes gene_type:complete
MRFLLRYLLIFTVVLPLACPVLNLTIVPNNIEFASLIQVFEEEHEEEVLLKELFSSLVVVHFNQLNINSILKDLYKNTFYPRIIIPPPDLT